MSLLSYLELRDEIQNKAMRPVPDYHVNSSSIDVTLGAQVLVEVPPDHHWDAVTPSRSTLSLRRRESPRFRPFNIEHGRSFLLAPGAFILAQTAEAFDLPLTISAEFRLKSSAGRMGLSHALAVWADAGWHGSVLTLELHNISAFHTIELRAGDRIGQMIFHRHIPVPLDRSYATRGNYNGDPTVQAARPAGLRVEDNETELD